MSKERTMARSIRLILVLFAIMAVSTATAAAQDMTASDVQRLEESVDQINSDIARLRSRDRTAARTFQAELSELDEDVTYLRVKLRRNSPVPRAEYMEIRDRIENLRSRVNGTDTSTGAYGTGTRDTTQSGRNTSSAPGTLPAGTELDVRLQTELSSDTAKVEDRFEATTAVDVREDGRVLIPAGSRVRGVVTAVESAGRVDRKGRLSLSFDQITVNGRNYPLRATVTEALESGGYREDAGRIGTGAAVGGIIGGILGGLKGALAGILIGGGGVVAATEGQDVELPAGTVLRIRLDQPLAVRAGTRDF
jgi:hypothetical protein